MHYKGLLKENKKGKDSKGILEVLIVDDNIQMQAYMAKVFADEMYSCHYARNGLEAVNLFSLEQHFDLVLMDIEMPIMNGVDAVLAIRKLGFTDTFILGFSSHLSFEDISSPFGFDHFLNKPDTNTNLKKEIQALSMIF